MRTRICIATLAVSFALVTAGPAAAEITGGSYARQDVANRARTVADGSDRAEHTADNPTFTGLSAAEPRYLICYRAVTNDTDHQLVACLDLPAGINITGDFMPKLNGGASNGIVWNDT